MEQDKLLEKLDELVLALGFDYDRLSSSGQAIYAELCSTVNQLVNQIVNGQ